MASSYSQKEPFKAPSLPIGPLVAFAQPRGQESVGFVDFPVVVACPEKEDMARQEFKEESDIAYQVKRFGAGQPFPVAQNGNVDFTLDLLQSMERVMEARDAWREAPAELRAKYATFAAFVQAVEDGTIEKPAPASDGGSSDGGDGWASGSAAGVKPDA